MWDVTLAFVAVILILAILWRKKEFSFFKDIGIPGPPPNLIFGNMWELTTKSPLECHTEWFKKYGNIVGYYFGTMPTVLIKDVDVIKKVQVRDFHKCPNRPSISRNSGEIKRRIEGFSQQLVTLRDKRWKEIRSILTPSFTTAKMRQMAPTMNKAIDSMMDHVEKKSQRGEEFDMYELYQGLTMDVIGRTAFGIHTDVQNNPNDPFLASSKAFLSGDIKSWGLLLAVSFRSLDRIWSWTRNLKFLLKNSGVNPIQALIKSVKEVISFRRRDKESRRPDLLQMMMDAQISESDFATVTTEDLTATDKDVDDKGEINKPVATSGKSNRKMTDADILDNSVLFFIAGYETTSTALAFTTHLLLHHPEVQDKVREEVQQLIKTKGELDYASISELQYLDQVIHEALRFYPPIYLFVNREVSEDIDVGPYKVPKGTTIQVPVYQLQRDPDLWEDPDTFNPDRFSPENKSKHHPMAFQAFGGGPRNCIGMRFALMEEKIALARLLSKYKLMKCSQTDEEHITMRISAAIINPAKGVYLRAVPV